jgi:hypothetical protein
MAAIPSAGDSRRRLLGWWLLQIIRNRWSLGRTPGHRHSWYRSLSLRPPGPAPADPRERRYERVLTAVAIGLLAVSVLRVGRWSMHRADALGRPVPFPAVTVVVAALGALGSATPVVLHARLEHALSAASSGIVGAPVRIHCQSAGETMLDVSGDLGHVGFGADGVPERVALVKWQQCRDIRSWRRDGRSNPTRAQVVAVHVLTHESMHMSGLAIEAQAECAAVQRDTAMARALGATSQQAVALARTYWLAVYPAMPDGYRSDACAPGGVMDERIPDPPWAQ